MGRPAEGAHDPTELLTPRPTGPGSPESPHAVTRWNDRVVPDRIVAWLLRAVWVGTAFAVWPAISAGLHHQPASVRTAAAAGGWVVWAGVLVATLVPVPVTLTALRIVAPGVLAATIAAVATGHPSVAATTLGVTWSALLVALVLLPETAAVCVNGPAYPNERRFTLAPPGALLLGPIELAWALTVAIPVATVLVLADTRWVAGAVIAIVGLPCAALLARALHVLSRRWLVFVPAGVVVHDPMALGEPVLFPRQGIESLAPGRDGLDLTLGALRPPLELRLREEAPLGVVRNRRREDVAASSLLVAPSTPGRVLALAHARRLPVGRRQRAVPPPTTASPS
jgi:hypothetical protein